MIKDSLVASAARLAVPSAQAVQEYAAAVPVLASLLDDAMLARPDLAQLVGVGNLEMMRNNHRNHFQYMAATMALYDAASFVETVAWVLRTYRAHGFALAYWPVMLEQTLQVVQRTLTPATAAQVAPFYEWLAEELQALAQASELSTIWESGAPVRRPACGGIP